MFSSTGYKLKNPGKVFSCQRTFIYLLYLEGRGVRMFKEARNRSGLSRDEAAFRLHIGTRTLTNYEHQVTVTPPEIALRMQEIYNDPTLTARYCSEYCPIGQVFAHSVPERSNLCQSVLGLIKEQKDVEQVRSRLIDIASDGIVEDHELADFKDIMEELLDLEMKIEELKLQAARLISIPAMMQKRKTALAAAR
jgi:DNA-binding XRE family transcriptional regulator